MDLHKDQDGRTGMLAKEEAVAMTVITICGIGCKPVSAGKRDEIQEVLDALWENGRQNGLAEAQLDEGPGTG